MKRIGVGLIGTGFMGKCHAMAYGAVKAVFGDVPAIDRVTLCDVDESHAKLKADEFGFSRSTTNWRDLLADPAIHLISITSPNGMHREMAVAALETGKHVWCEKPMALTLTDAEAMTDSAEKAKGQVTAWVCYLRNPACNMPNNDSMKVPLARCLIFAAAWMKTIWLIPHCRGHGGLRERMQVSEHSVI